MAERGDKRVVEEALDSAVPHGLAGAERGDAIVRAVHEFVFRFIESQEEAEGLFAFINSDIDRRHLATSYRGARWQQKVGLVLARPAEHPAHRTQVRAQIIEYGAIAEAALRAVLVQNGADAPPDDFDGIIKKARAAGVVSLDGAAAAQALRTGRNRIHLFLDRDAKALVAERDARHAFAALATVLQDCRRYAKLPEWEFGKGWPPDADIGAS